MPRFRTVLAAAAGCFAAHTLSFAAPDWTKVKAGMNGDEAAKLLGQPLMRTTARGFEVWVYDGRGEVVFSGGPLKAWTTGTPTAESLARPVDHDVLIRASRRLKAQRLAPVQTLPVRTFQEISTTHFRYLAQ
jgi:hypothetical protein